MPADSWKRSELISLYKGKGEAKSRGNCRSVNLLEHGMKAIEKIFEKILRKVVRSDEVQMGLVPDKGYDVRQTLLERVKREKILMRDMKIEEFLRSRRLR